MAIVTSYLQALDEPQRNSLLELMAWLAAVDGNVSLEEILFINETAEHLGVDEPLDLLLQAVGSKGLDAVCACFERQDVQAIALAQLIDIAFADHTYHATEREGIRAIATTMGVADNKVRALEHWVERGLSWELEGRVLMAL